MLDTIKEFDKSYDQNFEKSENHLKINFGILFRMLMELDSLKMNYV